MVPYDGPDAIAVTGLAGRFPDALDAADFWRNLTAGRCALRRLQQSELLQAGVPRTTLDDPRYVAVKGVLDETERFDASFFGYSPREVATMDPQQRLFLEVAHQALEDAGWGARRGRPRCGVFAGSSPSTYLLHQVGSGQVDLADQASVSWMIGSGSDYLALRVAYKLGLTGPAASVQTACSSSLTAVHLAIQSLLAGECDLAIAGGVSVHFPQTVGYLATEGGILSPLGRCCPFGRDADGTVNGDGLGVVALRRLEDAVAAGDPIRAVLLGSAVNNDGDDKVGFTAPSVGGQVDAITQALDVAGVEPDQVDYIECHGTGTPLGDPIETAALGQVFESHPGTLWIGSVKSNIGHLDAAAGIAGLIKAVLSLEHGQIPASIGAQQPNPECHFERGPLRVNTRLRSWPDRPRRRIAGVSSFGFGGTNVHLVLAQAPRRLAPNAGKGIELLCLSARTPAELAELGSRIAARLDADSPPPLARTAETLQLGRQTHPCRWAAPAASSAEAAALLRRAVAKRLEPGRQTAPRVAFLYPGQAEPLPAAAPALHAAEPVFRAAFDRCAEILAPRVDLRGLLLGQDAEQQPRLRRAALAQPLVFAISHAFTELWASWGIHPAEVCGHSVGAFLAAWRAGIFSLEDALELTAEHGRLVDRLPAGRMTAVELSETQIQPFLGTVWLSMVNAPRQVVIGGPPEAVEAVEDELRRGGIAFSRLAVSHAFPGPEAAPLVDELTAAVAGVERRTPSLPTASSAAGGLLGDDDAVDPRFWGRQLVRPVHFVQALQSLQAPIWLEIGPGRTLQAAMRASHSDGLCFASGPAPGEDGHRAVLRALGALWEAGVEIDWEGHRGPERAGRVSLPAYPFRGELVRRKASRPGIPRLFAPGWRRCGGADACATRQRRAVDVLFADSAGIAERLVSKLPARPRLVVCAGDALRSKPGELTIDPTCADDYLRVVDEAGDASTFVYLWTLGRQPARTAEEAERSLLWSYDGLVLLGRALAARPGPAEREIVVVTQQALDVSGGDCRDPVAAAVRGPALVLPQEVPGLRFCHLDFDGGGADGHAALSVRLCRELEDPVDAPLVALRGPARWLPELVPVDEVALPSLGGSALILGGFGGVGMAVASYLADHGVTRLALLGRSATRDTRAERLARVGAEVLVLRADLTDQDAVDRALEHLRDRWGGLDVIVHAAGAVDTRPATGHRFGEAAGVMAPKIHGTLNLFAGLARHPDLGVKRVLLFSSSTALYGGAGTCAYTAANAVLDSLAAWAAALAPDRQVVAVDWERWRGTGMAAAVGRRRAELDLERWPWLCHEHLLGGRPVVPGTLLLGTCLAAAAGPPGPRAVRNLLLLRPILLDSLGETRPAWYQRDSDLRLVDPQNPAERWAQAQLQPPAAAIEEPSPLDLRALRERCARRLEPRRSSTAVDAHFGPRWNGCQQIFGGTDEWLAELELPAVAAGDALSGPFHPALIDTALGAGLAELRDAAFLPVAYRDVWARGAPFPPRLFGHVRRLAGSSPEYLAFRVRVADDAGRLWLDVGEYLLRRVDPQAPISHLAPGPPSGLSPAEALDALRRVPSTESLTRVLVSPSGAPPDAQPPAAPAPGAGQRPDRSRVDAVVDVAWRRVLGVVQVAAQDNFFELGGDSLLALELAAQLSSRGLRVSPADIFDRPTPAGLSDLIAERAGANQSATPTLPVLQRLALTRSRGAPAWVEVLALPEPVTSGRLEEALRELLSTHPALRLRLDPEHSRAEDDGLRLSERLLLGPVRAATHGDDPLARAAADVQAGGHPHLRLLHRRDASDQRLALVAHPALLDGPGWETFLEALDRALRPAALTDPVAQPISAFVHAHRAFGLHPDELALAAVLIALAETGRPVAAVLETALGAAGCRWSSRHRLARATPERLGDPRALLLEVKAQVRKDAAEAGDEGPILRRRLDIGANLRWLRWLPREGQRPGAAADGALLEWRVHGEGVELFCAGDDRSRYARDDLPGAFAAAFARLARFCEARAEPEYTVTDFPSARLSENDLEDLIAVYDDR